MMFRMRTPALPFRHPVTLIATWFGSGLVPKAGGTSGSFFTLPFAWVIQGYFGAAGLFVFAGLAFAAGVWASSRYMAAGTDHDPNEIVIDEVAGQALLLAFLPQTLAAYALGFLIFRVFDVLKPLPVRWFDRHVHGGFGVMLDDILAALYPVFLYWLAALAGVLPPIAEVL